MNANRVCRPCWCCVSVVFLRSPVPVSPRGGKKIGNNAKI